MGTLLKFLPYIHDKKCLIFTYQKGRPWRGTGTVISASCTQPFHYVTNLDRNKKFMLERPKFKIKKLTKHRRKNLIENSLSTLTLQYPHSEPVFGNVEGAQQSIPRKESIAPAYAAWRAGTTDRVVVPACPAGNRFLGSWKGLQIPALAGQYDKYDKLIPWNTFLGFLNVYKFGLRKLFFYFSMAHPWECCDRKIGRQKESLEIRHQLIIKSSFGLISWSLHHLLV